MIDPIKQAIDYASDEEHEGAGFTLRIHTTDGRAVEVDVYQKNFMPYLLRRRAPGTPDDRVEQFFNRDNVTVVEVLW